MIEVAKSRMLLMVKALSQKQVGNIFVRVHHSEN